MCVVGEKVSPLFVGICVMGNTEGEIVEGMFVGSNDVAIFLGCNVGVSDGILMVGKKVSPRFVGIWVMGDPEGEIVEGVFVGTHVVGRDKGVLVGI